MPDLLLCDADIGVFSYVMNVETVVDTVCNCKLKLLWWYLLCTWREVEHSSAFS